MLAPLAVVFSVLSFFLVASNALVVHVPRAVSPTIVLPTTQTQWTLGGVFTVKWLTDGFNVTGVNGTILMGYVMSNGSAFLWEDQPLATGVVLSDGAVNVRCPLNLDTGSRYVVALLGDESNLSGIFSVFNADVDLGGTTTTFPVALSTTGNVPPATITRTSVLGQITASPTTSSSSSSTSSESSSSSSSSSATPTNTSSGCGRTRAVGQWAVWTVVGAMFAIFSGF